MEDKKQPESLTVKEAIEQGYLYCGYDGEDFQHLFKIMEIDETYFERPKTVVLADKEAQHLNISAKDLRELITDNLMDNSDFDDDTDIIPDYLEKEIDWEDLSAKINAVLKKRPYWYLTKIKLLPNAK